MQELNQLLLTLDRLYFEESIEAYEQERQRIETQIRQVLPGFTLAYATEIGSVGAGTEIYLHGGIAHVLLPTS